MSDTPSPARARVARDVVFSPEHGLSLDITFAPDAESSPTVLYAHGGGFARGSKSTDVARIEALATAGLSVASLDYRLAPDARFPDPIDDVMRAAYFLRSNADTLGLPPGPIGAIGASAGGYLVTTAALADESEIAAVSPWFAPSDLWTSSRRSPLEERASPADYEVNLLGDLEDERLRAASPINRGMRGAPPFLLIHGDADLIVPASQSEALHEALSRAGANSTFIRLGGAGHEAAAFDGAPLLGLVAHWFRSVLR